MLRHKNIHYAVFANGNVNAPLFNTPRNRLQNITESTDIRIKAQLGLPFSKRHNSLSIALSITTNSHISFPLPILSP